MADVVALSAVTGIGLRDSHFAQIDAERPSIGWLEVHTENFFGNDLRRHRRLERLRSVFPLSLHGVGLSLGSAQALDREHLLQVVELVRRYEPQLVSEHACWGAIDGLHSNQLLPLPRSREALAVLAQHVHEVQEALKRPIALEPIAAYFEFAGAEFSEPAFLCELVQRTGCQLLIDISNLHINACNHAFDAQLWLDAIPASAVVEYHLAGYEQRGKLIIDTHNRPVDTAVWPLYEYALRKLGPHPTLIEWDADLPALEILLAEMDRAEQLLHRHRCGAEA
jgi:uncharacterized protein (UPF0276 family)